MDILLLGDGEMYNVIIVQKPPQLSSLGLQDRPLAPKVRKLDNQILIQQSSLPMHNVIG